MNSVVLIGGKEIRVTGRLLRVGRLEGEKYVSLGDPETLVESLRGFQVRIDLFTFMQPLPETTPKYQYATELDNLAVLPISTYEHWCKNQIRFAPRGRLRQAEKKGVTTREVPFDADLVRGIWRIYNECPVRQGARFTHYGEDLSTVEKEEATFLDRSIFIGAFLGDTMIGFAKLVQNEARTQASMINIVSMVQHKDKCPTNALIAQAVRSCSERSISHLIYEKMAYGNKAPDGLQRFKEVNGFQRVDLPRYFVPLTWRGHLALRFGFHRRFIDRIPRFLVAKGRELRSLWYSRKLEGEPGAS
jgi:hypothetical protein